MIFSEQTQEATVLQFCSFNANSPTNKAKGVRLGSNFADLVKHEKIEDEKSRDDNQQTNPLQNNLMRGDANAKINQHRTLNQREMIKVNEIDEEIKDAMYDLEPIMIGQRNDAF